MSEIVIVGGCGHVGLALGVALAQREHHVCLVDRNAALVAQINAGQYPYEEVEGSLLLYRALSEKKLSASSTWPETSVDTVVFTTGTSVNEKLETNFNEFIAVMDEYQHHLHGKLVILRSTLTLGLTEQVAQIFSAAGIHCDVAYCPERAVQGRGIEEIFDLPQLVAGTTPQAQERATALFSTLTKQVIALSPREAEFTKLMTNSWRYMEFALANQFYILATKQGLDFAKINQIMRAKYPRAQHYKTPGLTAGPCLLKDTAQLLNLDPANFPLGQAAIWANQELPNLLVEQMEEKLQGLNGKRIALLGITFKADNEDLRESLALKIKTKLEELQAKVIVVDPYVADSAPLELALQECDGVLLGTPHRQFRELKLEKPFVDCWGFWT